jgi:8-oxo-dGTP pyrophosphatase MutT (NUDIX family)
METRTLTDRIVCSGALFYAKSTRRFLLLQKAQGKHTGTWGLVGGTNLQNENPWQGLQREVAEEIGFNPAVIKTIPLETFVSNDTVFNFHTYLCVIEEEFIPELSNEHIAYAWANIDYAPKPLHQGLRNSFTNKTIRTKLQTVFEIIDLI